MKKHVPDAIWPSDNDLGIPSLNLELCADALDIPFRGWGTIPRRSRMPGTWHFYVDDYRFSALWKDPSKVVATKAVNCVEPNFTVHEQLPRAVVQWRTYQKRWLARYWQAQGIRIFVDMNVHPRCMEDNLVGVPVGWSAFATRGYNDDTWRIREQHALARAIACKKDVLFVVYGGGLPVKDFCQDESLIWLPEQESERRDSRYDPFLPDWAWEKIKHGKSA